jgi:predicted GIY-YIG superfamily endonuclease
MEYTFYKLSIAGKCYVGSTTDFDRRIVIHKIDVIMKKIKNIIVKCINI